MEHSMRTTACVLSLVLFLAAPIGAETFRTGKPELLSMSALAFSPDGVLFVGDGKGGAVYAFDLQDDQAPEKAVELRITGIEEKIAAALGTRAVDVMVHDLAVNPVSQNVYLAVSRGRGNWTTAWQLPNDIADASVLLRVRGDGSIDEVVLEEVGFARGVLSNPVDPEKTHAWKTGVSLRADTITDMAYDGDTLWVAGLSNEEFASTVWRLDWPFRDSIAATTLEVFHGAHGEWETHAPIRTLLPYTFNDSDQLLAAYLCTPLVTFPTESLADGEHVRGRTIAEFGWGNAPLDMVAYEKNGEERILIANSNLPFMIVKPEDIAAYEGSITARVEGYVSGVAYEPRSGTGILQMDRLNDSFIVTLRRQPGGTMDMLSVPVRRF